MQLVLRGAFVSRLYYRGALGKVACLFVKDCCYVVQIMGYHAGMP